MLCILFNLGASVLDCDTLYTKDGCPICITHFSDRQCAWCADSNKCVAFNQSNSCQKLYYGPEADCSRAPSKVTPTPAPIPPPEPKITGCSHYTSDGCDVCVTHYKDRNCGWNAQDNKCENANETKCPQDKFYYGTNAKCGQPIPPPTPTPWPKYEVNTSFCRSRSNTWCSKCLEDPEQRCVWCHETRECVMGDKDGFFFGTCPGKYSHVDDDQCKGLASKGAVIGIRVGVAIWIVVMSLLGIWGCYYFIKQPAGPSTKYDEIH